MASAKWQSYYAKGFLPWDTRRPASQLVSYISSCWQRQQLVTSWQGLTEQQLNDIASQAPLLLPPEVDNASCRQHTPHYCCVCSALKPKPGAAVLEIGCGSGASSCWLAAQGYRVTGIDIIQDAINQAKATAAALGLAPGNSNFLQLNIFDLPSLGSTYDMIYDCQVYHALVHDVPDGKSTLPQLLFDRLKPGGFLFMLTGNANEPEIGPSVLTGQQLLLPLFNVGFELVLLMQTRFDSTDHYMHQLKKRPLAWWVVLRRPVE